MENNEKPIELSRPRACYVVGASLIVYLLIAVIVIVTTYMKMLPLLGFDKILRVYTLCGGFGMLGASMAAIRKYYSILITESVEANKGNLTYQTDWSLGWIYYYLTRPILGGILGSLSYLLTYIGFQVLATPSSASISEEGRLFLYAIAFLSGFSVSHVLTRLEDIAKQAFENK